MNIVQWPEQDRPREKLLQKGAAALSDAELLAIFIRTGVQGKTAVDIAREIILNLGGLNGLLSADREHLLSYSGMGPAKVAQIEAALEMSRRALESEMNRGNCFNGAAQTATYVKAQLAGESREVFACLFLDNQHRLISFEKMFFGSIASASVYPREIVKRALELGAAAVILAHNHPSGVAEPSQSDLQITQRISQALDLVDIRTLDHFIIGDGKPVSFAERGLI